MLHELRLKFEQTVIKDLLIVEKVSLELEIERVSNVAVFATDKLGNYKSTLLQSMWNTTVLLFDGTPGNMWSVQGGEDPHKEYLNRERSSLAMGNLTDDQLANEVYLYGDNSRGTDIRMLIAGKSSIAYLTAAKERIRWLSRKLEQARLSLDEVK